MTSQAFSKQVATLVDLAYPAMFGMAEEAFAESLAPLAVSYTHLTLPTIYSV